MITFAKSNDIVPILPVHDSFICHQGYAEEVRKMMADNFKKNGLNIRVSELKETRHQHLAKDNSDFNSLLNYDDMSYD